MFFGCVDENSRRSVPVNMKRHFAWQQEHGTREQPALEDVAGSGQFD